MKAIAVGLSAIVSIGIGFAAAQNKDSRESQPLMHIHNLYADANGETHFRDIKIEPATEGPGGTRFPMALSCLLALSFGRSVCPHIIDLKYLRPITVLCMRLATSMLTLEDP